MDFLNKINPPIKNKLNTIEEYNKLKFNKRFTITASNKIVIIKYILALGVFLQTKLDSSVLNI